MKISNSKKQLAQIIHENGGWRDGYDFAAQDGDDYTVWFYDGRPVPGSGRRWKAYGRAHRAIEGVGKLPNWHQTILSRDEYFHLLPEPDAGASRWGQVYATREPDLLTSDKDAAPDADGWIEWGSGGCPVAEDARIDIKLTGGITHYNTDTRWGWNAKNFKITHYRLHKPEQECATNKLSSEAVSAAKIALMGDSIEELVRKPTIEQLAADYRNRKDYADRKQQEADAAKADADAKLAELVAAGKALGLVLSAAGVAPESELVITDWRDLRVGDRIWVGDPGRSRNCPEGEYEIASIDSRDSDQPIGLAWPGGLTGVTWPQIHKRGWRFIRRPAKGGADA